MNEEEEEILKEGNWVFGWKMGFECNEKEGHGTMEEEPIWGFDGYGGEENYKGI